MRERRYLSVVTLRKEDYERLGVNGTREGASVPFLLADARAKHKRLMAFVNDLLFLVVVQVTLSYIRHERRGRTRGQKLFTPYAAITRRIVSLLPFIYLQFSIPWSGKEPARRFHFNGILIRR